MEEKRIHLKWTKPKCLEEAKKYSNAGDWIKASVSSWKWAQRNKFLNECTHHMIRGNTIN